MTNEQYYSLLEPYQNACQMLLTRLEVLNHTLYQKNATCPIHTMQHRLKQKKSIEEKLERLGLGASFSNARDHLLDMAGIRIICYFVGDIYNLSCAIKKQNDLILIKEKDYIKKPKPKGFGLQGSIFRLGGIAPFKGYAVFSCLLASFCSVCESVGKWISPTKLKTISTF